MMKHSLAYRYATILLFVVLSAIIVFTFRDYGISWDEEWHLNYGDLALKYVQGLLSGIPAMEVVHYRNLYLYGAAFDMLSVLLTRALALVLPLRVVELHHLVNALVGLLGIIGTWATARLVAGEKAAFWSTILLAVTPLYIGHIFFNPKDIPFAAGYIWALFFLVGLIQAFPAIRWRWLVPFGLAAGLTMGVRVGGVLLLGYFGLALLSNYWNIARRNKTYSMRSLLKWVILPLAAGGGIAWLVMILFWPYAQLNPVRYPLRALLQAGAFSFPYDVLYKGQFIPAAHAPRAYLPTYLGVLLPEIFLALLLGALVLGGRRLILQTRSKAGLPFPYSAGVWLAVAALLPVMIPVLAGSTLYDGARHFIFILPPLACLAGWTWQSILEQLARRSTRLAVAALVGAGVLLLVQIVQVARLHPYEYVYYNQIGGGFPGVVQTFETDFWGTAASAAASELTSLLEKTAPGSERHLKVFVSGANPFSVTEYLPPGVEITYDPSQADYLIGGMRGLALQELPGKHILVIARLGVPLALVNTLR